MFTERRWKPHGKLIVQAIDHKFHSFDENASPRRWRSFSPGMWALYLGWVHSLQQEILWQEFTYDLYNILSEYMLPEQPPETECPECPEPPPPPEQPRPGGGSGGAIAGIGVTGLSVEELEGLLMGSIMKIGWGSDGKLYAQYFPCCDWIEVEYFDGAGSPILPALGTKPPSDMSLQEWLDQNKPDLGTLDGVLHQNPQYNTDDSVRCAKATAIYNIFAQFLDDTNTWIEETITEDLTLGGIVAILAASWGVGGPAGLFAAASLLFGLSQVADDVDEQITNFLADEDFKNQAICDGVRWMDSGTAITDGDINDMISIFDNQEDIEANELLLQFIYAVPMMYWKSKVQGVVSSTECGCEQYLPYGGSPALPAGSMRYTFKEFGYANSDFPMPADGADYNAIITPGLRGELFGGQPSTQIVSTAGGDYVGYFQAIFEFTAVVQITSIKFFFTYPNGVPAGTANWSNKFFTEDFEWQFGAGWGNINDNPEERALTGDITHFSVGAHTANMGSHKRIVLSSVLVSGTYLGEPFIDLPPNTIFET